MTSKQLEAALELARRGVRQFPQDRNKRPIIKGWPEAATTDEAQLRAWAKDHPTANFAAACGKDSGILVVDVDVKNDQPGLESLERLRETVEGLESLERLRETVGNLATYIVRTPSGGMHLYFKYPDGADRIKNLAELDGYPGIELKADRGCVTVAGSFYASGAEYVLVHDGEFAPLPAQLLELVKAKHSTTGSLPRGKIDAGKAIPKGQRNVALTSIAGSLRRRGLAADTILAALLKENETRCNPPLAPTEVASIAESVAQYDIGELFTWTDHGNAERLVYRHGNDIRYVYDRECWIVWNGQCWEEDRANTMQLRAHDVCRAMYEEALELEDEGSAKQQAVWALRSMDRSRLTAMVELAKALTPITVRELDADPFLLCVDNGVVDLRSGELREFRRTDYITKRIPVTFDASAKAPRWTSFLNEIMDGNANLVDFLRRSVGYSLTGSTEEQCLWILHGSGANGKTTFLDVLLHMLGDYAKQTQPETIMLSRKNAGQASPELAELPGVRLLTTVETAENSKLNESLIKQLTGQDRVSARRLYHDFFEFVPEFKLWLASNHLPTIAGTDHAIWRRIHMVPFLVTIPAEDQDKALPDKLRAELPGILNWVVQGCLAWQEKGLEAPLEVTKATNEYRSAMDVIADFLGDCIEEAEVWITEKRQFYRAYEAWCKQNGEKPLTQRELSLKLQERGYTEKRQAGSGTRCWAGVAIKSGILEDIGQV